jgi:hypothetical protein
MHNSCITLTLSFKLSEEHETIFKATFKIKQYLLILKMHCNNLPSIVYILLTYMIYQNT